MEIVCQVCGSKNIENISKIEIFEYKGQKIELPDYKQVFCRNCGESVADSETVRRSVPLLRDAQRVIDGLMTGDEIRSIRKSFKMTQAEFSQILGGGEKAFARYETGKVAQSKSMDNLLRILRKMPEVIDIIKPLDKGDGCFTEEKLQYIPNRNENLFEYIIHENTYRKLMA
jgi:HTH-type transcriptional regulator/antitoxin MqsA